MIPTGLSAISRDHGLPQKRFYNLICLALGADHADLPIWRIIYLQHDRRPVRMNTEHWCVPSKGKSLRTSTRKWQGKCEISKLWLSLADHKRTPHDRRTIERGAPKRDVLFTRTSVTHEG